MAIIDSVNGLEVQIIVNGVPLLEYEDMDAEPSGSESIKYIEAVSGAKFAVRWTFGPGYPHPSNAMTGRVYLDGRESDNILKQPHTYTAGTKKTSATLPGIYIMDQGVWKLQSFVFSDLTIDESSRPSGITPQQASKLGEIKVTCMRVHVTGSAPFTAAQGIAEIGSVTEKELKGQATSHKVSLGAAQTASPPTAYNTRDLDSAPIAVFRFKYRSLAALKSLHVIRRTPSPVPLEDREIDTLTPEEMRELIRRQREQRAASAASSVKTEVKRERSDSEGGRAWKVPRVAGVEVVDLTSDE